jgi:hypothetical protein
VATKKSTIDKGGFVENVANASLEPEEKKVRGQAFTYAELGGVLAQDVEDRKGFGNGGSNTLDQWQLALEQQQSIELTPDEIKSEEHFQRIKDEPGLGENAPLIETAAALYGIPRAVFGIARTWYQKQHLNPTLWHGGPEGLSTIKAGTAIADDPRFAKFKMSGGEQRYQHPAIYTGEQAHTGTRYAKFFEEATERGGATYKLKGTFPKDTSIQLGGKVFGKPPKALMADLNAQIDKTIGRLYHIKKENPLTAGTNEALYSEKLGSLLDLKHMLRGNFSKVRGQTGIKGEGIPTELTEIQYNFLKKYDIRRLRGKLVFQGLKPDRKSVVLDQDSIEIIKKIPFGKSEGGLVGEMSRLGFAEGEIVDRDNLEVTYGRGSDWLWDSIFYWTPVGSLNNVSSVVNNINQKKFPRVHDWLTRVTKFNKAVQEGFVDPLKEFTSTDWGIAREESRRIERNKRERDKRETDLDESGYGSLLSSSRAERKARRAERRSGRRGAERRAKRRGARDLTTDAEIAAIIAARKASNVQRGAEQASQLRSEARARGDAMFQREAEALSGTNSGTEGSRGTRRVMFNEGSLVKNIDNFKTTYDNFSAKEVSELQRLLSGRVGFADGELVDRKKRMQEYKQEQQDLEDFISDNRLVSKEAQMSLLSGEGYRDPRFIPTTGNKNLDHWGLYPLSPDGSGQVLYDGQMGLKVSSVEDASVINTDTGLSAQTLGTYDPNSDQIKYQTMTSDLGFDVSAPEETQTHEIIHRASKRSGYREQRVDRLDKRLPKHLKDVPYYSQSLAEEILAHGLQHKLSGGNFEDKELLDKIKFRISKYVTNDKIKKQYMEATPFIVEDFEEYLNELEDN